MYCVRFDAPLPSTNNYSHVFRLRWLLLQHTHLYSQEQSIDAVSCGRQSKLFDVSFCFVETGPEMAKPISLQDLVDKCHLSPRQLDKEVSEEHLRDVSRIIADHEIVGPELGLSGAEMVAVNADARTHQLKKMEMLKTWNQKFAWNATYRRLIEALLNCHRVDSAYKVCELLAPSKHRRVDIDM